MAVAGERRLESTTDNVRGKAAGKHAVIARRGARADAVDDGVGAARQDDEAILVGRRVGGVLAFGKGLDQHEMVPPLVTAAARSISTSREARYAAASPDRCHR